MTRTALLLASLLLLLISCDKDDSLSGFNKNSLVGTWNLTALDAETIVTIDTVPPATITASIENSQAVFTFKNNGTWSSTGSYDLIVVTNDTASTRKTEDTAYTGTWSVSGDIVTMRNDDPDTEAEFNNEMSKVIMYVKDKKIVLRNEFDETQNLFGIEITSKGFSDVTFEQ